MVEQARAWYDYFTDYSGTMEGAADKIDITQFEDICEEVLELIEREAVLL